MATLAARGPAMPMMVPTMAVPRTTAMPQMPFGTMQQMMPQMPYGTMQQMMPGTMQQTMMPVYSAAPQVTSGSYAPPTTAAVTSGSYVPTVGAPVTCSQAAGTAPAASGTLVSTMRFTRNVAAPAASSSTAVFPSVAPAVAASGSYAPMPMGTTQVMSGSYVPPVSGSYAPPPVFAVSGSYVPPVPTSGSYAPPPMLARSGSYGPVMMPAPGINPGTMPPVMLGPPPGANGAPRGSVPDLSTIEAQKGAYKTALDKQFQSALAQIESQREATKQMLRQTAQQQKDQYSLQARSALEGKKLELDTQLNSQLIMLQETAMVHRKTLEEKAAALTLDFQQRKAQEDLLVKQYQIQKQFVDNERQLEKEYSQKQQSLHSPAKAADKA